MYIVTTFQQHLQSCTVNRYVTNDHGYVCRNHIPILSSFMTYHRVCNKSNTTGAMCDAGTAYPSGASEFTPVFSGVRVARSLVVCVVFCRLLFILFLLG
jgi:hypothetical protein